MTNVRFPPTAALGRVRFREGGLCAKRGMEPDFRS